MNKQDKKNLINLLIEVSITDGAHHKQWGIDQALRLLMGERYEWDHLAIGWDQGIAP